MSAICIIDTSVFCNILDVPNRNQRRAQSLKELRDHFDSGNTLLLPLATIYETGNHIAQQGDGRTRRRVSELFVQQVKVALEGGDRKSTRLNSSHVAISYAVFCLKKKNKKITDRRRPKI